MQSGVVAIDLANLGGQGNGRCATHAHACTEAYVPPAQSGFDEVGVGLFGLLDFLSLHGTASECKSEKGKYLFHKVEYRAWGGVGVIVR